MSNSIEKKIEPVTRTVTTAYGKADGETVQETLEVREFITAHARVSVEFGMTLNLSNFESARVSVQVSLPCYAEEVEAAYGQARKWVEDKMNAEVDSIRAARVSFEAPQF